MDTGMTFFTTRKEKFMRSRLDTLPDDIVATIMLMATASCDDCPAGVRCWRSSLNTCTDCRLTTCLAHTPRRFTLLPTRCNSWTHGYPTAAYGDRE